jgi:class 3 adenylate cyclase
MMDSGQFEGERRLAAIMFTDMVGFTTLAQRDEALAMQLLDEQREIIRPLLAKYGGREVDTIGDAFLVEFASSLGAVRCPVVRLEHPVDTGTRPGLGGSSGCGVTRILPR